MLNPSIADLEYNDPTVARCQRRAQMWGYAGFHAGNIFALRSTDPSRLYSHPDPVGEGNDQSILRMAEDSSRIICGWGNHGQHQGRGRQVLAMLKDYRYSVEALKMTGSGQPGHPLYIGYAQEPFTI